MAISITGTPAKTKEGYSSKWIACNNPVAFAFSTTGSPLDDFIQVALYSEDGLTQLVELKRIPFPTSESVTVDFQAFLQSLVSNDNDSLTTQSTSETDKTNQYKVFRIGYRTTTDGSYTVDSTEYIALNAVRQAGAPFGQNMADYLYSVDYIGSPMSLDFSGQFLTEFSPMPLFYSGAIPNPDNSQINYYFPTLAFIITDEFASNETGYNVVTKFYDSSGTLITTITDTEAFGSPSSQKVCFINLGNQSGVTDELFDTITVSIEGTTSGFVLIPELTYKLTEACNNPTALKWKNDLGGWDTFVFEGNSPVSVDIEISDTYATNYSDITNLTEVNRQFQKRRLPTQSVTADSLTLNEAQTLSKMLSSPHVLTCIDDLTQASTTAENWVTVNVLDGNFLIFDKRLNTYRTEIEFELLEEFTISN